jgi:hypothetical protein
MNFIYSFFCSIFCIFICLIIILFAFKTRKKVINNFYSDVYVDLIFFTVIYRVSFYMLLPAAMRILSGSQFETELGIDLNELLYVYVIEFFSYMVWFLGILYFSNKYKSDSHYSYAQLFEKYRMVSLLFCCFVVFMFVLKILFYEIYIKYIYIDIIFVALIGFGGYVISPFLMVNYKQLGIIPSLLGTLGVLLSLSIVGTRGIYVGMTLWLIFLLWYNKSKFQLYIYIGVFIFLIISFINYGGFYKVNVLSEEGKISIMEEVIKQASPGKLGGRSVWEEVEFRFGSATRLATGFIRMRDRGAGAGINPIWNSIQSIVPRYFWPDKPAPSSVNGDIYGQGMYLMGKEVTGIWWNMCEFPEGLHAYWEFGFLGVIFLSFIPAAYVVFVANYFSRFGFLSVPLLLITFKPWGYTSPKLWVSEIIFQFYSIIIPSLLLIYIINFFMNLKFTFSKCRH